MRTTHDDTTNAPTLTRGDRAPAARPPATVSPHARARTSLRSGLKAGAGPYFAGSVTVKDD